jgi:hypothetical protein
MDYSANQDVAALQRLCQREGGTKAVAEALGGVNDQSIYQIVTRKTLPSGREKGIGPSLRDKLDVKYPGWNRQSTDDMPKRLKAALATVAGLLQSIPEDQLGSAVMDIAEVLQRGRHL